jgi:Flp pilus assembly protein TadG
VERVLSIRKARVQARAAVQGPIFLTNIDIMQNQKTLRAMKCFKSQSLSTESILNRKGQAAVEFALISVVAMIVLFVAVQLALIGEDALALGQMNYQGARWAAVNTCAADTEIINYILFSGSPSVTQSGGSCGTYLTMNLTDTKASTTTRPVSSTTSSFCTTAPTATTGCANPRQFGTQVTVQLSFGLDKAIFLLGSGNNFGSTSRTQSWLGVNFPTQLTSTETAMAE